jgi:hypothetical protein
MRLVMTRFGGLPQPRTIDYAVSVSRAKLRRSEWVENATLWAFITGLAWVPFWYGSNVLLAWGINALLFPGLAGLYEISLLARRRSHDVGIRHLGLPAASFVVIVLWIFIQVATWVPTPLIHPIWGMAAEALGQPVDGSISVNRDLTNLALLRVITAGSAFWIALQLCRNHNRADRLIGAIAVIAAIYAVYGLIAAKAGELPLLDISAADGRVSSTFYNPDSYATYAGLGFIAAAGLVLQAYQDRLSTAGSWRHQAASFVEATGQTGAVLLSIGFVILVALLLTGSRGGVVASALGLAALGVAARRQGGMHRPESIAPFVFGFVIVAAAVFAFGAVVAGKIEQGGLSDPNRMAVYLITFRSILDKPLLGFGHGTFRDVFPMYRDHSISVAGIWGQAHDTYLEILQGLGLVFGAMLIGIVVLLVLRCLRGARQRQQNVLAPRIATGAACLVGVHALIDFSLQMQAITLTFMTILGCGVAQSVSSRRHLGD